MSAKAEMRRVLIKEIDYENKRFVFRHAFDVRDLENSIRYEGLIYHPILLEEGSGDYKIVSGYRRLMACKNLGLEDVLCLVYPKNLLGKEDLLKISIAENTKRKNLLPVEIAEALLRIKEELDMDIKTLAEQFGETFGIGSSQEVVERYLRLNLFDQEAKDFLATIPNAKIGFEVASIPDSKDRETMMSFLRENRSMKPTQVNRLIKDIDQLKNKEPNVDYKGVFEEEAIRKILDNHEQKGSKKIQAFLEEISNKADPDRRHKQKTYQKYLLDLEKVLEEEKTGLSELVQVRKDDSFEKSSIRIVLDVSNSADLVPLAKVLYEKRKSIFGPLIDL